MNNNNHKLKNSVLCIICLLISGIMFTFGNITAKIYKAKLNVLFDSITNKIDSYFSNLEDFIVNAEQ